MSTVARLNAARALLNTPPDTRLRGQLAIPDAALALLTAAEEDATTLHENDHQRAERVAAYLTSSGWTITPTT
ncbi:hypothetical protein ABZ135_38350 [Streptomyces sp. NPDC006339]|uniref:hypothetical protein n=1 Tax=Streptomyces sp. NPDC006339 TaxID=3156755 RepID=UPI0033A71E14